MNSIEQKQAYELTQFPSGWTLYKQNSPEDDYWLQWKNQIPMILPQTVYNIITGLSKFALFLCAALIFMFGVLNSILIVAALVLVVYLIMELIGLRHNFTYLHVTPTELQCIRARHKPICDIRFRKRKIRTFSRNPETTRVEIQHRAKIESSENGRIFVTYCDITLIQPDCKPECIATYTDNILAENVAAFFTKLIENGKQG